MQAGARDDGVQRQPGGQGAEDVAGLAEPAGAEGVGDVGRRVLAQQRGLQHQRGSRQLHAHVGGQAVEGITEAVAGGAPAEFADEILRLFERQRPGLGGEHRHRVREGRCLGEHQVGLALRRGLQADHQVDLAMLGVLLLQDDGRLGVRSHRLGLLALRSAMRLACLGTPPLPVTLRHDRDVLQVGVHALPEGADGGTRVLLSLRAQQPDGGVEVAGRDGELGLVERDARGHQMPVRAPGRRLAGVVQRRLQPLLLLRLGSEAIAQEAQAREDAEGILDTVAGAEAEKLRVSMVRTTL